MMDLILEAWVSGLIEWTKLRWMMGAGKRWAPGRRLNLLFAGYNGTRNTGADVRVEEMLRQVRTVLGNDRVELSVLTQNFDLTRGYFHGTRQVRLPDIFPPMLAREVPEYDGVVACEGSMFKSKFANALTTMMIGSLGMAASQNKLSVGYGAEAGAMDPILAKMCRRYCGDSLIITRNEESASMLSELGISSEQGTDTAWTFEAHPPEYGRRLLREAGWDERRPVLVVCPINPFWWPVRASVAKYLGWKVSGAFNDHHYRSVYFHHHGPEVVRAYDRYLNAVSRAISHFADGSVWVILVAMEALDNGACREIAARIGGAPVFSSSQYDMYQLVSILRSCDFMVSSRYHGIVTAMPALVPSAGITMDERIRNLMRERGQEDLLLEVEDPDLEERLLRVMRLLRDESDRIRDGIGRTVAKNLKMMARMGVCFERNVQERYPEFPIRRGLHAWEEYLPPLSPGLEALLRRYECTS
ncbi:MAG: polysaccharide pyruvyl transferase family protein [Acidobacteria bacterium]|nr:polysaccharide pyruvyl transferase family protein [Acidobacteriota bacterium]